jgi:hypothetical protein
MPDEIPYMTQVGNISAILNKIQAAGAPPKFTHDFLSSTLGFSSSGDRGIIKLLREMGFLSSDNTPTARYNDFRSTSEGPRVLADGLRQAYPGIFLADTLANTRTTTDLNEIFKRVSGKGEAVAKKMAATFKTLAALADWTQPPTSGSDSAAASDSMAALINSSPVGRSGNVAGGTGLSLHHDVHIHLPASSDVAVYTAIFRALKDELLD